MEDSELVGDSLKLLVKALGFEVDLARSGPEALAQWRAGKYQAVITDLRMTGMQGDELAVALKALNPQTPVILLTGFPPRQQPPAVDIVLLKPCGLDSMRDALRRALRREDALEPARSP